MAEARSPWHWPPCVPAQACVLGVLTTEAHDASRFRIRSRDPVAVVRGFAEHACPMGAPIAGARDERRTRRERIGG